MQSIRELGTMAEVEQAARVLADVWGAQREVMPASIMRALQHSGNYVVGLFDGERMVGASVAFFGPPAARSMHSHITGVLPEYHGRGWGRALKNHQRDWALAREVGTVTWTFDPLIARNAHFNLNVLGVRVTDYLVNEYGALNDALNHGDESDRLMVAWSLAQPATPAADADVVRAVAVPDDVEALRAEDPEAAGSWRRRVREEMLALLGDGLRVRGFATGRGYLFVR